jgi:hypothetical protein
MSLRMAQAQTSAKLLIFFELQAFTLDFLLFVSNI